MERWGVSEKVVHWLMNSMVYINTWREVLYKVTLGNTIPEESVGLRN